ncbi:4751_t:CDS:2 [Ambispora gerdemannii]|uniref:4751_t:CDS:1 n=1 Tax=Ambispora gerdemannii TaxID=144530 RepID=A0A9N9FHQ3_9GLOM|nr:4751_t:CDS:2 [Ambispora gerdemannii]
MKLLPFILDNYIIKTDEKINKFNVKVYCKSCVKVLGEAEAHLKKCVHFATETTSEQRKEIYNLVETNISPVQLGKRKEIAISTNETISTTSRSSASKILIRNSSYGPMDNYIV